MEPDPREPTGDLGYDMAHEDMAHEVTGGRPRPEEVAVERPEPLYPSAGPVPKPIARARV